MSKLRQVGVCLPLFAVSLTASCTEKKIGGFTVEEVFHDSRVAELARAGCDGDVARVEKLVAAGVPVDSPGKNDGRPLLWVLECRNHAGLEALLSLGADPNYPYEGKASAMWIASREPDVESLESLIRHGGDVNRRFNDMNPLMRALILGTEEHYWANYDLLLESGADINQPGELDRTVAEFAVTLGQFGKLYDLLQRGYSYKLDMLMAYVDGRMVDKAREPDRLRVLALLRDRGIKPYVGHTKIAPTSDKVQ